MKKSRPASSHTSHTPIDARERKKCHPDVILDRRNRSFFLKGDFLKKGRVMKPSQPAIMRESCCRSTITTITTTTKRRRRRAMSTIARVAVISGGGSSRSSSTSTRTAKLGYRYGRILPFALMGLLIASFWLPSNLVNADSLDASYYDQNSTGSSLLSINGNFPKKIKSHKF